MHDRNKAEREAAALFAQCTRSVTYRPPRVAHAQFQLMAAAAQQRTGTRKRVLLLHPSQQRAIWQLYRKGLVLLDGPFYELSAAGTKLLQLLRPVTLFNQQEVELC